MNTLSEVLALYLLSSRVPANRIISILRDPVLLNNADLPTLTNAKNIIAKHRALSITINQTEWDNALRSHEKNHKNDLSLLCINDKEYPKSLKLIKNPPPVMFVKGETSTLKELPGIAIVGAREATVAGKEIARRVAKFMAEKKWVIVSGLALGIDAAAHQGSLDGKGKTIAVLAGGLDKPSPAANSDLGYEILENGGLWVSEHSLGTPPKREHFVPRNRIQIGLSTGSIIVEAKKNSGSITQAKFCTGQNRPLFAVIPHAPENPLKLNSEGTEYLVTELGAIPVKTKEDYSMILKIIENEKNLII